MKTFTFTSCLASLAVWLVGASRLRLRPQRGVVGNVSLVSNDVCHGAFLVKASSDINDRCPEECPLYVEAQENDKACDFACVESSFAACAATNPHTPVVDETRGECRRCQVLGCDRCRHDGTERCKKCLSGYVLDGEGYCHFTAPWLAAWCAVVFVVVLAGVFVALAVIWIIELSYREKSNPEGLKHGLEIRSRAKIHMPKQGDQPRQLFPMNTNLCNTDVAGPAVMLLLNFQAAVIIWASVMALTWYLLGCFIDGDLLELGTREAKTARQDCIIVKWGFETQHRLMYVKIGFLTFAYVFSFVGAILFGIRQKRLYQHHGAATTHQDYCVIFRGLPQLPGTRKVEKELEEAIYAKTKLRPIGVSVGWDAGEVFDDLQQIATFNVLSRRDVTPPPTPSEIPRMPAFDEAPEGTLMERFWAYVHGGTLWIEHLFISPTTQKILSRGRRKNTLQTADDGTSGAPSDSSRQDGAKMQHHVSGMQHHVSVKDSDADVKREIEAIMTSSTAFAVFETERARDQVLEFIIEHGFEFPDASNNLTVEKPDYEPSAVLWQNLTADHSVWTKVKKVAMMSLCVLVMVCCLGVFEALYAKIQLNNVYATGEETISLSFIMFTMMVGAMMAILCVVSAEVSDRGRFERVGQRETCFVLLYTFSVILQVTLDLVIAYWVGKRLMEVNQMRTYDGTLFSDLRSKEDFVQIFEAYGMQKQLGVTVLSFGFPCAFLLPFLAEPIVSIYLPYKIMSLIVRSHKEITGEVAAGYLEAVPMDLGRYGDLMINVIIATLILFFPGGFNVKIFVFLACSHTYIYWYDHYRLLRSVQSIYISSPSVDWWAQWLFGIPCALMMAALVQKANCQGAEWLPFFHMHHAGIPGATCDNGTKLIFKVVVAFFTHMLLHTAMLLWVVPLFAGVEEGDPDVPYRETAAKYPSSWFSANMIHCLRSRYVYGHNSDADPPFDFCVAGREELMRYNPKIGAFFRDDVAETEEFKEPTLGELKETATDAFSKLKQKAAGFGRTLSRSQEVSKSAERP